jgi:hypothetical protein
MIKRYLLKRDNPWEVLALASIIFFPGVALLLQREPVVLISPAGRARVIATGLSPFGAHVFGALAVAVSVLLAGVYLYALRSGGRHSVSKF